MSPALAGGFFTTEPPGKHWGPVTQSVIYLLLWSFGDLFLESSIVRLFNTAMPQAMLEYGGPFLVWKLVVFSPEDLSWIISLMKFLTISVFSLTDWLCWYWISWTGLLIVKNLFSPIFLPFILLFYFLGVFLNFIFPPFLWVFILKFSEKNSAIMFYFFLPISFHSLPPPPFSSLLFCSLNVPWIAFCSGFTAQFLLNHHNLFPPSLSFCLFLPWVFSYCRLPSNDWGSLGPNRDSGDCPARFLHRVISWADSWGTSSWQCLWIFVPGLVIFLPAGSGPGWQHPKLGKDTGWHLSIQKYLLSSPLYLVDSSALTMPGVSQSLTSSNFRSSA